MNRYVFLLFLVVGVSVLTNTPMVFSASLLTDVELDTFGSGGEGLEYQAEEIDHAFLSEKSLDSITAQGLSGNVWPFQYVPDRIPVFRGFLTFPGKEENSTVIQFRGGLQFRESTPNVLSP